MRPLPLNPKQKKGIRFRQPDRALGVRYNFRRPLAVELRCLISDHKRMAVVLSEDAAVRIDQERRIGRSCQRSVSVASDHQRSIGLLPAYWRRKARLHIALNGAETGLDGTLRQSRQGAPALSTTQKR